MNDFICLFTFSTFQDELAISLRNRLRNKRFQQKIKSEEEGNKGKESEATSNRGKHTDGQHFDDTVYLDDSSSNDSNPIGLDRDPIEYVIDD